MCESGKRSSVLEYVYGLIPCMHMRNVQHGPGNWILPNKLYKLSTLSKIATASATFEGEKREKKRKKKKKEKEVNILLHISK